MRVASKLHYAALCLTEYPILTVSRVSKIKPERLFQKSGTSKNKKPENEKGDQIAEFTVEANYIQRSKAGEVALES